MRKPDFFIVGAPKCGTTSLNDYLKQHPDIFMPDTKEPHFFGKDLYSPFFVRDLDAYLSLFSSAGTKKRAGDASVWYLYSRTAAAEIKEFCPSAGIIIMLRNPVDMIYSLHSQRLWNGNEDIDDFEQALQAEEDRKRGLRLPKQPYLIEGLFYRETAKYADQVKRYIDLFGREQVHIIIFEDFRSDTKKSFTETLRFLGVSPVFKPLFSVSNPNKKARSKMLRDMLKRPPEPVRRLAKLVLPRSARDSIREELAGFNTLHTARAPLSDDLKKRLQDEFRPDIEKLGIYIGRDLVSLWVR